MSKQGILRGASSNNEYSPEVALPNGTKHKTGTYTREDIQSPRDHQSHLAIKAVASSLHSAPSLGFTISSPRYMPVTADFLLKGPGLGAGLFVELKLKKCHLLNSEENGMIAIKHRYAHNDRSAPIFVAAGGRWTYLLTELYTGDEGSFIDSGNVEMPSQMLFLHRSRIPSSWWYSERRAEDPWVYGSVPQNCIVRVMDGFASQIRAILDQDTVFGYGLPELEDLRSVDPARLVHHIKRHDATAQDSAQAVSMDSLSVVDDPKEDLEADFTVEGEQPTSETEAENSKEDHDEGAVHHARASRRKNKDAKVLGEDVDVNLANVSAEYSLSEFPVMAQRRGILVPTEKDTKLREIPTNVNLAIALTLTACKAGRGVFLWQRKDRERCNDLDCSIPDILSWDFYWTNAEKISFSTMGYGDQRDYLNADVRLQGHCVVLPYMLDFPGPRQDNTEDARVVTSASLTHGAISLPGCAYIGWVKDMIPIDPTQRLVKSTANSEFCFWLLDRLQRDQCRVNSLDEMYCKALEMWLQPPKDARIYYKAVTKLVRFSMYEDNTM